MTTHTRIFYLAALLIFFNLKLPAQTFLDKSKWDLFKNYDFNAGDPPLSNDWAFTFPTFNDLHQWDPTYNSCNDPNNVYIQDGILHVRMQNASPPVACDGNTYNYTSGMLRSKYSEPSCSLGTGGYLYGMFEIRCKMAKGAGMYSAFWLSGHDAWPPEIDVFEYNGRYPKLFFSTDHWFTDHCAGSTPNCSNNITINNTNKNITMPSGWGLVPDQLLTIYYFDSAIPGIDVNKKIEGKIISYNNATGACSLSVISTTGTGSYTSWRVCCERGACNCTTFHEKQTAYGQDDEYHTYTLIWTPTELSWFFDGKEIRDHIYFLGSNLIRQIISPI
ncbi:MAG: family 16 glycosylhydrolase [Cytophagaceae bacterium]|nr:family 16 glycosylhydrolase [Cytophagaceae bacterium]